MKPDQAALVKATFNLRQRIMAHPRPAGRWSAIFLEDLHGTLMHHALRSRGDGHMPWWSESLDSLVVRAQTIIEQTDELERHFPATPSDADLEMKVEHVMRSSAEFLAACVDSRPFSQLNDNWSLLAVNALLASCGFRPGIIAEDLLADEVAYRRMVRAALAGDTGPLAEALIISWLAARDMYRNP